MVNLMKTIRYKISWLILGTLAMPAATWAGNSCNALLNMGLYNVGQSSSASEGQSLTKSTFCSADYSSSKTSSDTKAAIEASYGLFSGSGSGSSSKSEIIAKQASVCTSGFNSSAYSDEASAYAQTVYQGSLDAWNKCQELSNKGLDFEVRSSSTLQGVTVIITPAAGVTATFNGIYQDGSGQSVCKRTIKPVGSTTGKTVKVDSASFFKFSAAEKVTINCKRIMKKDADGNLSADAQDLIFVTSADSLRVPLAAIGNLSRVTYDQIKADFDLDIDKLNKKIGTKLPRAKLQCRDVKTSSDIDGGGNLIYLDRHNLQCNDNEYLTRFHLTRTSKTTFAENLGNGAQAK